MTPAHSSALTLVGLLDVFALDDGDGVRQRVVDSAAESFGAEVVGIVCTGRLVRAVGLSPHGPGPDDLIRAATSQQPTAHFGPLGELHLTSMPIGGAEATRFVVARSAGPFSPEELRVARAMVRIMRLAVRTITAFDEQRQVAVQLEDEVARNRELADELHRRHGDLMTRMLDIQSKLTSSAGSVLSVITHQGGALFANATMAIQLREPDGTLRLHHLTDGASEQVRDLVEQAGRDAEGLMHQAMDSDQLVEVGADDHRFGNLVAMSAPIYRWDQAIGALTVMARSEWDFSRADRETLLLLAGYASVAMGDAAIIEQRQQALEQAEWQATHDPLTGLANRRLVLDEIDHRLAAHDDVDVLYIDVDRFKAVNDLYGHQVGDRLIQALAQRLTALVRAEDVVGRLAGDEFIIVCGATGRESALHLADRVGRELGEPIEINGQAIVSSVSIGLATSGGMRNASDLINAADVAMYQAKSGGRNGTGLFDEDLQQRIRRRAALAERITTAAVNGHGLHLVYQPIVELETGKPCSHEALLRFTDPALGPVPTDEFVTLAEELGAMATIDNWVLQTALTEAARARLETSLSVNVSPAWLTRTDAASLVAEAAARSGFPLERLALEVTERVALADTAQRTLAELRGLGIRVLLDDFGTGYSSLAYVRTMEIDGIKIDRAFLDGVEADRHRVAILEAILTLTDRLGAIAIAEGVESGSQAELLAAFGCRLGQGFYFSRPGRAHERLSGVVESVATEPVHSALWLPTPEPGASPH
jgi:diguanylate cyclase (GGDEF)-like protein